MSQVESPLCATSLSHFNTELNSTRDDELNAEHSAYIDSFWFATMNFVLMLLLLVRTPKPGTAFPAPVIAD